MELLGLVGYVLVKLAAYVGWCFVGVHAFDPGRSRPLRRAAWLGVGRLCLGIAIGAFIFVAALTMNNATRNAPLTYLAIYVPVRIVEWLIMHAFVGRVEWPKSAGWVLGGVIVSCVADIPLGIMNGGVVPVGRPFC